MMVVPSYLAPSQIEGLGVFARRAIARGELVWKIDRRFDLPVPVEHIASAAPHVREFLERYTYPLPSDPEHFVVLDADEGRFMNHASRPNVIMSPDGEEGHAAWDIPLGEELTCDYGEFAGASGHPFQSSRHAVGAQVGMAAAAE